MLNVASLWHAFARFWVLSLSIQQRLSTWCTNHRSSQEHAIHGTPCLLLPSLNLITCHIFNLRSINLILYPSPPNLPILSSFVGALHRQPWPFLNIIQYKRAKVRQGRQLVTLTYYNLAQASTSMQSTSSGSH